MLKPRVLAAFAALGVLLVVVTGRTTEAFWTDARSVGTDVVPTGTLELLTGDADTQSHDYEFAALRSTAIAPGGFAQAPLTVRNSGSADLRYHLAGWSATSRTLADSLRMTVTSVAEPTECTPPGADPQPGSAIVASAMRSLAPAQTETLCIRATLARDAPQQALSGTTGAVTYTWYAEQEPT